MSQLDKKKPAPEPVLSPAIQLPDEAIADLNPIAGIDDETFAALLKAIGETEPTFALPQFGRKVFAKVPGISEADLRATLTATVSLHSMLTDAAPSISLDALISGIVNSSRIENKAVLGGRLMELLKVDDSLGVTAKARDVMTEHDHIFCKARILSDIRPVFSDEPDRASGAVIIHHLKIGYHQDHKHRDFYVALDTNDLAALKETIARAEKKSAALEAILKQSKVPYLEV